jgi:FtsP/CotA-like multicopper oxidase with cupredoxin domain
MFYRVPPRRPGEVAATVDYHYLIAANHLPGIYWVCTAALFSFFFDVPRCAQSPVVALTRRRPRSLSFLQYHPHKHGATYLQSGTAHGLIVVEDDARWLPADGGCAPLAAALAAAPEAALDFEVLPFAGAGAAYGDVPGAGEEARRSAELEHTSYAQASEISTPDNPLCCGGGEGAGGTGLPMAPGPAFNTSLVLLNGGWQPVVPLVAGEWARWRMLHSGSAEILELALVGADGAPAPGCEILLVAKDGVYMPQIPRATPSVYLSPANRADVLVRCAEPGNVTLASGTAPSQFGNYTSALWPLAQAVATVTVAAAPAGAAPAPALAEDACTPLRPSYAPDLRDAALKAAGVIPVVRAMRWGQLDPPPAEQPVKTAPYSCMINDAPWTYPDPAPLALELGTVAQWEWAWAEYHRCVGGRGAGRSRRVPLPHRLQNGARPFFPRCLTPRADLAPPPRPLASSVHTHINPHQLVALDEASLQPGASYGAWFRAGDYHDSLILPMNADQLPSPTNASELVPTALTLRIQPGEFSGWAVAHCHLLAVRFARAASFCFPPPTISSCHIGPLLADRPRADRPPPPPRQHEDQGCMAVLKFACPGYGDDQPVACDNFTFPVEGTYEQRYGSAKGAPARAPAPASAAGRAAAAGAALAAACLAA